MIGVIADDLTGAAELGAVGSRHGLRAEIVVKGKPGDEADLVCVDTNSRGCTPAEAGQRAAAAANLLRHAGARWIYKKVDSVLRGNVTAEVEAVMNQLGFQTALLLPANPALGRTIEGGKYFVRGKLINRTEFARDPEHPRKSSLVLRLLNKPKSFPICVCGVKHPLPEAGIVVCEAASTQDVCRWAGRRDSEKMLVAGGAEFFGALLAATGHEVVASPASLGEVDDAERELFVCGTTSVSSRKFVSAARVRRTPVFSLPVELGWGADFSPAALEAIGRRAVSAYQSHRRVILNVGLPMARERAAAGRLVAHLARLAEWILRGVDIGRVYAEGGATAAELMRRMEWSRLTVLRELSPGVVVLAVAGDESRSLTIKPGSYVWPESILHGNMNADTPLVETN